MVSADEYVAGVLEQVRESRAALSGDAGLDEVRREWHRLRGLASSLAARLGADGAARSPELRELAAGCRSYAEGFDFAHEIEAVSSLYPGDPHRARNLRLKVLESLDDGLYESAERALRWLGGGRGA